MQLVSIFGYTGLLEYKKPMQEEPQKAIEKEKPEIGNWAEDQAERGYYYDDSHGYEKFDPDAEDDEEDDDLPEAEAES